MSERMFETKMDDVFDGTIINITRNGENFAWFFIDDITDEQVEKVVDLLNALANENNYLKKRIKAISDELYCKDRKLEELGIPIECCDE